jgi:hypothetical protein
MVHQTSFKLLKPIHRLQSYAPQISSGDQSLEKRSFSTPCKSPLPNALHLKIRHEKSHPCLKCGEWTNDTTFDTKLISLKSPSRHING